MTRCAALRDWQRALRRAAWGFFVAALLVSCASHLQKPEVSLAGVELIGLGLVEQRVLLRLRVANPNEVDLPIKALTIDLEFNGRPFSKGASERPVVVARRADAVLDVMVLARLGDVLSQLRETRKSGSEQLGYRLHGRVELEGYGSVPFERSGELPLSAFERFVPK